LDLTQGPRSYTKADNSVVVATDSIKNTVFITAKQNPVTPPELFGSILGTHFIEKYSHIHAAHVNIVTHRWVRMDIDGKPHPHSFIKPGTETRDVQVDVIEGKGIDINSAINGLTVLKSTGSQFWGFVRDEYTTLKETWDRILSTDVAANWQWRRFTGLAEVKAHFEKFNAAWEAARAITLKTFAEDNSASVQATMYKMGEQILAAAPLLDTVSYALPNNHFFEIGTCNPFPCESWIWANRCGSRPQLAQGPQEHRQGRRGVRPPVQPQRSYQVHRCPLWPKG
jgi:urate oxidase